MNKFQSGVTYYDPAKCYNGYTLWSPLSTVMAGADNAWDRPGETYLMDMSGNIVHSWKLPFPTFYGYLLPTGNLLVNMRTTETTPERPGIAPHGMGGTAGYLAEVDWDGNIVFMHKDLTMHHDFKKLPNGNYMYLGWEQVEPELKAKVRGGIKGTEHSDGAMWADVYKEVSPEGEIVWEYHIKDYLDTDIDIIGCIHTREEWSHINDLWVCENGDIVSSSRHLDAVLCIDRATGKIKWRLGSPTYTDADGIQLSKAENTIGGPHDAHIIPSGLPGAGNMLCYDNGMYAYRSRALELDVKTGEIVWTSTPGGYVPGRTPFSCFISGARRVPNGNTVICEGANGHLYEVTPENEVVWEYWKPMRDDSFSVWPIFRCFRYGRDYCPQFASLPAAEGPAVL